MTFRFPDIPAREIHPSFIDQMKEGEWIAQIKWDGWRAVVEKDCGHFIYRSRSGKPIVLPDKVRVPFEEHVKAAFRGNVTLDCELTGKRREGDADGIFILDLLHYNLLDIRSLPFIERLATLAAYTKASYEDPYFTPWTGLDFRGFLDYHKAHYPLAEGLVFKTCDSKYIGSTVKAAKNPGWVKCKWRVGQAGLSPNE